MTTTTAAPTVTVPKGFVWVAGHQRRNPDGQWEWVPGYLRKQRSK